MKAQDEGWVMGVLRARFCALAVCAMVAVVGCGGDGGGGAQPGETPNNAPNNAPSNDQPDAPNNDQPDAPNNAPNNDQPDVSMDAPSVEDVPQEDAVEPDAPEDVEADIEEEPPSEDEVETPQEDVPAECSVDDPCPEGICNLDLGVCEDRTPCFGPLDCLGGELGDRLCAGCEDGDCGDEGGVCRDRCQINADCAQGELCVDGGCGAYPALGCTGDADCPGRQRCDNQAYTCVDAVACAGDEDCGGDRRCDLDSGVCQVCLRDVDCPGLQNCELGGLSNVCREPAECLRDEDCAGLRVCELDQSRCVNSVCLEDRFEPNNRVNENVVRLNDGVLTGLRICGGEADLFLVTPPQNQALAVLARVEGGPVRVEIYEGGANPFDLQEGAQPLASSTGDLNHQGAVVPAVDSSATYLVVVSSDVEGIKSYELQVLYDPPALVEPPCDMDEPGASEDDALPLGRGEPLTGEVCSLGQDESDEDWVRFQQAASQAMELTLVYDVRGDGLAVDFFQRVDNALVALEVSAQPRSFGLVYALAPVEEPRTVFARVRASQPEGRAGYAVSLDAVEVCPRDAREPNDSTEEPSLLLTDLEGRVSVEDLSVCLSDADYFVLQTFPDQGVRVRATLAQDAQGAPPSLALLEVRGDDLVPVGRLSVDARSSGVALGRVPQGIDRYVVEVQAVVDGVTPYTLDVEVSDEPFCELNDDLEPSDADNIVPMESPRLGAFLCSGEEDWYRVTVSDGQDVELNLTGLQGAVFDLVRVADQSRLAEGVEGRLVTTVEVGGELAVVVRGRDVAVEGNYTLTGNVTADPPANDACGGAAPLAEGEPTQGTLRGARDDVTSDDFTCFALAGSSDVVYVLESDFSGRAVASVTPIAQQGEPLLQPTVFVTSVCQDVGEILDGACASDFDDEDPNDGTITVPFLIGAEPVFLWVDGGTEGSVGDFEVQWELVDP